MKTFTLIPIVLMLGIYFSINANAQVITTYAGDGSTAYGGDGGAATTAQLYNPYGIAIDRTGNLYIADYDNNRVRKVNSAGIITTFAGTGSFGYSGDGGAATAAQFNYPNAVAADASGNVYISDHRNYCIRKVDASGVITTFAGTGTRGYSGDGGPATAADLNNVWELLADGYGNVYIADRYNHRIRKIDASGIISTFAGNGTGAFSGDGGPATAASLNYPFGMAIDGNGNFYIGDYLNMRIRKVNPSGIISTVAGAGTGSGSGGFSGDGGPATAAMLARPCGLAVDCQNNLYIADWFNQRIRKVDAAGIITTFAGNGITSGAGAGVGTFSGDGGLADTAGLNEPTYVVVDALGNLFIDDDGNSRIRKVSSANHPPAFAAGNISDISFCANAAPLRLDTLLAASDIDTAQTITWMALHGPAHGTVSGSYATRSTGAALTPAGIAYNPASGFSGIDTFSFIVSDCMGADTLTFHATVNPSPHAGVVSGKDTICAGDTTTLTATITGGTWASGNTTLATINAVGHIIALNTGTVTMRYIVTNICGTDTALFTLSVRPAETCPLSVAINEREENPLVIFPNPAVGGVFTITFRTLISKDAHILITSPVGITVLERVITTNAITEEKLNVAPGIYFITIITDNATWNQRMMITR